MSQKKKINETLLSRINEVSSGTSVRWPYSILKYSLLLIHAGSKRLDFGPCDNFFSKISTIKGQGGPFQLLPALEHEALILTSLFDQRFDFIFLCSCGISQYPYKENVIQTPSKMDSSS